MASSVWPSVGILLSGSHGTDMVCLPEQGRGAAHFTQRRSEGCAMDVRRRLSSHGRTRLLRERDGRREGGAHSLVQAQ